MRPSRTSTARTITIAIATLLALGAFAPGALAGTLAYDGNAIVFTGGDNLDHEVQFRLIDGRDHILDTHDITAGPGDCQYETAGYTWVSCPPRNEMRVDLGSGSDSVTTAGSQGDCFLVYTINLGEGSNDNDMNRGCTDAATATITSGSGEDTLRGGSASTSVTILAGGGADTLNGGDGNDVIHGGEGGERAADGGPGNDQVFGEGGNDVIRGGDGNDLEDGGPGDDDIGYSPGISHDADTGADQLRGGDGSDILRLNGHQGGMTINLDGVANDGTPGEGDNIGADIEKIYGTSGNDTFTGSGNVDNFEGEAGNDDIHGGGGNDDLYGSGGDDRVFGDGGSDKVQGAHGADVVDGGPGTDQIYGDTGNCTFFSCPSDSDRVFARDGERDTVDCGGGADQAQVDQLDVVVFCASVDRQTAGGAAGPGAGGAAAALGLRVAGSIRSRILLRRGLVVQLTCPGACKIVAELRYKARKLGSARKTLLRAGPARLVVKVSRKAKRTVRRLRRGRLTLRLKVTDAAGQTTTLTKGITLRR